MRALPLVALAAACLGATLMASPAQAAPVDAIPHCTSALTLTLASGGTQTVTVPAHPSTGTGCVLSKGDKSGAAALLQNALVKCHAVKLKVDGEFGELTRVALSATQKTLNLPADGVYGPATRDAMFFPIDGGTANTTRCVRLDKR